MNQLPARMIPPVFVATGGTLLGRVIGALFSGRRAGLIHETPVG